MSPVFGRILGYSIFLLVAERGNDEPPHVHVRRYSDPAERSAKFWIAPEGASLAINKAGISDRDLKKIEAYINMNKSDLIVWYMQVTGRI